MRSLPRQGSCDGALGVEPNAPRAGKVTMCEVRREGQSGEPRSGRPEIRPERLPTCARPARLGLDRPVGSGERPVVAPKGRPPDGRHRRERAGPARCVLAGHMLYRRHLDRAFGPYSATFDGCTPGGSSWCAKGLSIVGPLLPRTQAATGRLLFADTSS